MLMPQYRENIHSDNALNIISYFGCTNNIMVEYIVTYYAW